MHFGTKYVQTSSMTNLTNKQRKRLILYSIVASRSNNLGAEQACLQPKSVTQTYGFVVVAA